VKLLVADPPWEGQIQRPKRDSKYEGMKDYERLPVKEIQKELSIFEEGMDASLIWCIDRYLSDELTRMSRFETRRTIIWWKAHAGIGWNVRYAHEYIMARWNEGFRTKYSLPSVLVSPRTDNNFLTSKPLEILITLVDAFVGKSGIVCEAYKGSDNLKRACEILGTEYREIEGSKILRSVTELGDFGVQETAEVVTS